MNFSEINSIFERIEKIFNPENFDFLILVFNFCIALIFLIIFYDLKPKNLFSKDKKYLILLSLIFFIDFIIECIFGNFILIPPIISVFSVNILFLLKDKDLFYLFNSKNKNKKVDKYKDNSMKTLNFKINRLGKTSGFNLIDILYIYDYITDYQRRKVIQEMIYDDVDEMIKYLNTNPAVSDAELKEAKGILNLININGKILTKEEALLHLVDMNSNKENSNTEDKINKGS